MKILTGLPHEKNGGHSLALFGKPRIRKMSKSKTIIYVDCHILTATKDPNSRGYIFSVIDSEIKIPTFTESKMRSIARKIAKDFIKSRCWNIRRGSEYIQSTMWCGFYFHVV